MTKLSGLAKIDSDIKRLRGVTTNVNNLIQDIAVAIVVHTKDHGDCSRALALVEALPNSFRRGMAINWFAYYGNIGIDAKKRTVKLIDSKSKRFRNIDVDGAKANPWYEEASVPGQEREYLPNTLMEFTNNVVKFADRLERDLHSTFPNTETPKYDLTDSQTAKAEEIIRMIRDLGTMKVNEAKISVLRAQADKLEADLGINEDQTVAA